MIYLVRHAEPASTWGETPDDPGLSETGLFQAAKAAETLVQLGARRCVSSPMRRCRETAAAFERAAATHSRIDPAVSEIATPAEATDRVAWLRGMLSGNWADAGASYQAWRHAILDALLSCDRSTAVFTHFVAINAVVGLLNGDDRVTIFRPGHASITQLERTSSGLRIVTLGSDGSGTLL